MIHKFLIIAAGWTRSAARGNTPKEARQMRQHEPDLRRIAPTNRATGQVYHHLPGLMPSSAAAKPVRRGPAHDAMGRVHQCVHRTHPRLAHHPHGWWLPMTHVPAPRRRERFKPQAGELPFDVIENAIVAEIGEEAFEEVTQHALKNIEDHPHRGHPWLLPEEIIAILARGWARADEELGEEA